MHPKPKKSLGQNFLIDKNIQAKIIKYSAPKETENVLEIGPGRGELTQLLLEKAKKVIAVEIDELLCKLLREKFSAYKNFELINADILKLDLSKFGKLKVIANLPYYISSPAIAHILNYRKSIKAAYLTLQKELAMRLCCPAGTKDCGAISCLVGYYSQPRILFPISNSCFWPRPKVDSCFIELKIFPEPKVKVKNETLFFKLIRLAFNQRRKLLKNSLSSLLPQVRLADCLEAAGLKQKVRAEELSLSDFARLADYFSGGAP